MTTSIYNVYIRVVPSEYIVRRTFDVMLVSNSHSKLTLMHTCKETILSLVSGYETRIQLEQCHCEPSI